MKTSKPVPELTREIMLEAKRELERNCPPFQWPPAVDWQSMFYRFIVAVRDANFNVAADCLYPGSGLSPQWTNNEIKALELLMIHGCSDESEECGGI